MKNNLILCPKCKQKAPLKVEKLYDDAFRIVGEKRTCSFCRKELAEDQINYVEIKEQTIFDPTAERKICHYCKNYVVNPWTQKCTRWEKEVTATDSCDQFEKKPTL